MNNNNTLHFEQISPKSANVGHAYIETDDFTVQVQVTFWGHTREDQRKARVYVSTVTSAVDYSAAYKMAEGEAKDAEFKRLNRLEVAEQKATIEEARQSIEVLDTILGNAKLTFSRTAGCSCGCSPAFVPSNDLAVMGTHTEWNGNIVTRGFKVRNIFITKK